MKIVKQQDNRMVIELENGAKVKIDKTGFIQIVSEDVIGSKVSQAITFIDSKGNIETIDIHSNLKEFSKKKVNESNYSMTRIFPKGERIWDSICNIFTYK